MAKKARRKVSHKKVPQKWHAVPLKGSFMVMSIIGFLITAYMIHDTNYKFAFMLVFIAMFVASLVSMTKAPVLE
ncbi:MAG TPA: hypothetical protein VJB13_04710 [Candidatus Nanoarchaeia archaeon]|nr:hypothetical protein [Candidatus Nanoarchaeia archaeon]